MKLDKLIQERYSCKNFSKKKPNWRDIIESIDAARYAPMAGGMYSLKFIMIDDENKIEQLAEAAQQEFIKDAHFVVVVVSKTSRTKSAYEERADRYLNQQAGAAIQNFLLKLTEKGLCTCWVGSFVDDQVKEILGTPGDGEIEAIFPIGYEDKKPRTKKAKIDLDKVLYFNRYGNKNIKPPRKLDV